MPNTDNGTANTSILKIVKIGVSCLNIVQVLKKVKRIMLVWLTLY